MAAAGPAGRVPLVQRRHLRRAELRLGDPAARHADALVVVPARRWSALVWFGIARRDWRAGAILLAVAAGLLPWFYYALDGRTMFSFYAAPAVPFLVLAVVYVLGAIIAPAGG